MGLVFQVPVAILAATRLGIVTPAQLRHNRRYALVACAGVAAFLPGDVITLVLETVPLYVLYEASILVASLVAGAERRREEQATTTSPQGAGDPPPDPAPPREDAAEPTVQELIDHTDRELD
jgi:Sec-independent protein secretion pathway component TatC